MASRSCSLSLLLFFLCNLVRAELVLEDGYEVKTVFDGRKFHVNPRSVQAVPGSSDLIVLDSPGSTFNSVSLPLSADGEVKRIAGDGISGNSDGEAAKSRFDKPRSFTVDAKGNLYVADKNNKAIRKISLSGTVTTIAGGISKDLGRRDGPAQNATFSNDFDITFVPQGCCLLVCDHGNQLIRQINLKKEDCPGNAHSNLGTVTVWSIGLLVLSCFLGVGIGIAVRPYVIPHEGMTLLSSIVTWKLYLIKLGKQVLTLFSDIRNEAARASVYCSLSGLVWMILSHLSLMCQLNHVIIRPTQLKKTASLLDTGSPARDKVKPSLKISSDLKDLISFDNAQERNKDKQCIEQEMNSVSSRSHGTIDDIIKAHMDGFSKMAEEHSAVCDSSFGGFGLVKRRK